MRCTAFADGMYNTSSSVASGRRASTFWRVSACPVTQTSASAAKTNVTRLRAVIVSDPSFQVAPFEDQHGAGDGGRRIKQGIDGVEHDQAPRDRLRVCRLRDDVERG